MKTQCPKCKAKFNAPNEYQGKKVKCPKCEDSFICAPLQDVTAPANQSSKSLQEKPEKCENCNRIIGKLEKTCVFEGNIVCRDCFIRLQHSNRMSIINIIPIGGLILLVLLALSTILPWVKIFAGGFTGISNPRSDGMIILIVTLALIFFIALNMLRKKSLSRVAIFASAWGVLVLLDMAYMTYKVSTIMSADDISDNPFAMIFSTQVTVGVGLYLGLLTSAGCGGLFGYIALKEKVFQKQLVKLIISYVLSIMFFLSIFIPQIANLLGKTENQYLGEQPSYLTEVESQQPTETTQSREEHPVVSTRTKHTDKIDMSYESDGIRALSKPIFGIYLGEKLDNLRKRLEVTFYDYKDDEDSPFAYWFVKTHSETVKMCLINTFEDRVANIHIIFEDNSKSNFEAIESQLRNKYQIIDESDEFTFDPQVSILVNIDNTQVLIQLQLETKFMEEENTLSLLYIHNPLSEAGLAEKKRRKATKIRGDL